MSDYLFARPSFVSGAARSLDLAGVFDEYNYSSSGEGADALAMYLDMQAVGCDLAEAVAQQAVEDEQRRPA